MKRFSCATLALLFLTSTFAATLASACDGTHPQAVSTKGMELSGKVSDDGKVLTADDDNDWHITNIEILKGLEGRYVTVKCRMDVSKRAIRVLSVEEPSETRHTAHLGDAAFRR